MQSCAKKSAINFVTDCWVMIVTLVFKYIKSTTELIFIIVLRHIRSDKSEVLILIPSMPGTQEMIFPKMQPLVHAHSELSAGCLQLQFCAFRTDQGSQKVRAGASGVPGCSGVPCILQP